MTNFINDIIEDLSNRHREILNDWCKAYLAELWEKGEKEFYPSMFTLCETEFHEENGKMVKNYYIRSKNEIEIRSILDYQGWKPIESAPEETRVLVTRNTLNENVCIGSLVYGEWGESLYWKHDCGGPIYPQPTHWMYLPEQILEEEKDD